MPKDAAFFLPRKHIGCLTHWEQTARCFNLNLPVLAGDKTFDVLSRLFRNVGDYLDDPYVLLHMALLSGLFKPMCLIITGCTHGLLGIKSINHSRVTY